MALPPCKRRKTNGETLREMLDASLTSQRVSELSTDEQRRMLQMILSRFPKQATSSFASPTTTATSVTQATLPYRGLAREIRDMIYDHLLYLPNGFRIEQTPRPPFGLQTSTPLPLTILRANKQTRAEALERLFAINTVICGTTGSLGLQYLRSLDVDSLKSIRHLQLDREAVDVDEDFMALHQLRAFVVQRMRLHTISVACPRDGKYEKRFHATRRDSRQHRLSLHYEQSSWCFDSGFIATLCDALLSGDHYSELRLMYGRYYGNLVRPEELELVQNMRTPEPFAHRMRSLQAGQALLDLLEDKNALNLAEEAFVKRTFVATIEGDETRGTVIVLRKSEGLPSTVKSAQKSGSATRTGKVS